MRFADISFFSIWFSLFVKNTSGFSVLVPNVVFGFSYFFFPIWTYLGILFCMRFSVLADFVCGFAVLDEFFFGFAVSSIPQCPPQLELLRKLSEAFFTTYIGTLKLRTSGNLPLSCAHCNFDGWLPNLTFSVQKMVIALRTVTTFLNSMRVLMTLSWNFFCREKCTHI